MPRPASPTPSRGPDGVRPARTYVVFGYPLPRGPGDAVTVAGTARAPDRRAAAPLARALADRRGRLADPPAFGAGWTVRWWAAGACRRAWVLRALERDGAALLAADRT